jgi:hypothetical protein
MSALSGSNTINIDPNGVVSVRLNPYGIIDVTDAGLLLEWAVNAGIATLGTDTATQVYIKSRIDTLLNGKQNAFSGQSANRVYAGPESGDNAIPGFRPLVPADIPWLNSKMDKYTLINAVGTNDSLLAKLKTLDNGFYTFTQTDTNIYTDMPADMNNYGVGNWYCVVVQHVANNKQYGNVQLFRRNDNNVWNGNYSDSSALIWRNTGVIKGTGSLTIGDGEYTFIRNNLWYSIKDGRVHIDFRVDLNGIITAGSGNVILGLPTAVRPPVVGARFRTGAGWLQSTTSNDTRNGLWFITQDGTSLNFWVSALQRYLQYADLTANSVFTGSITYDID